MMTIIMEIPAKASFGLAGPGLLGKQTIETIGS